MKVYEKIARSSNGQVFNMNKTDTSEVLMAIKSSISPRAAQLKSVERDVAGENKIDVDIDSNIEEFSVSLSGHSPQVQIKDPKNETREGTRLKLETLEIVKVERPMPGKWNVNTKSSSAHTVKLSGMSNVTFKYGFSFDKPSDIKETTFQPIAGI